MGALHAVSRHVVALWVLGPSSGADQQGAIRHPGLGGRPGRPCARTAEPASAVLAGSSWRLTEELRRGRVGRWWWQPRRATARQAWQGEQGCAQHRCRQSLFLKASNQTRRPVPTKPNQNPTRLDLHDSGQNTFCLTSPHLHCPRPLCDFVISHFSIHRGPTGVTAASTAIFPHGPSRSRPCGSASWCDRKVRQRGGL